MGKYDDLYEEKPKYRKRKKKKSPKKANHKHEYVKFIGVCEREGHTSIFPIEICKTCGKKVRNNLFFLKKEDGPFVRLLSDLEEIKDENPSLKVIMLDKQYY